MAKTPGKNAIVFIFITVVLNMIGIGVIMPVMPQLLMDVTGSDVANAAQWGGILSAVYALMQFITMPIIGGLSDRFGRRPILLISLAAFSLDYLIMALAPTMGIIFIARLLAGVFAATFSTANAYIADITPPEKRAANFGLLGAAFGLGFIIGPAIGGILGESFGPRAPFYFVAAVGAVNFVFGLLVLPETLAAENRRKFEWKRANAFGSFLQFRRYPIMLPIAGVLFLSGLAHWTYPSVWSYYADEKFGWTPGLIGVSLMVVGLSAAVVQAGLIRVVIPKFGEKRTAVFAMLITAASYFAFGFAQTATIVFILIIVSALGGLAQPALQGLMSRTMPADAQGELQGAVGALNSLTMIIGPLLVTQIFAVFSKPGEPYLLGSLTLLENGAPFYFPGAPFAFAAILECIAVVMLVRAFRHMRPKESAAPGSSPV